MRSSLDFRSQLPPRTNSVIFLLRVLSTCTATSRIGRCRSSTEGTCSDFDGIRCSVCDVGIESTVIGIDCEKQQVCRWIRALIRYRSCCFGAEACLSMRFCRVCRRMEWRGVCGSPWNTWRWRWKRPKWPRGSWLRTTPRIATLSLFVVNEFVVG